MTDTQPSPHATNSVEGIMSLVKYARNLMAHGLGAWDAAVATVNYFYPLDNDPIEAWEMLEDRLQNIGTLHCVDDIPAHLLEFGSPRTIYQVTETLLRCTVALEINWHLTQGH